MPIDIIHDVEKGIAALIDPEAGRALGPVAIGDGAVKVLESFAGIHGVDPATLTPATLERRFEQFIETLLDVPHDEPLGGQVPAGHELDEGAAPIEPGDTKGEAAPPTQAALDEAAAKRVERADALGEGAQVPSSEQAPADQDHPQASPGAGQMMCPTCDGFHTVVTNGVEEPCSTCQGTGVVAVNTGAQTHSEV